MYNVRILLLACYFELECLTLVSLILWNAATCRTDYVTVGDWYAQVWKDYFSNLILILFQKLDNNIWQITSNSTLIFFKLFGSGTLEHLT